MLYTADGKVRPPTRRGATPAPPRQMGLFSNYFEHIVQLYFVLVIDSPIIC